MGQEIVALAGFWAWLGVAVVLTGGVLRSCSVVMAVINILGYY